jgi:hypothetical protein
VITGLIAIDVLELHAKKWTQNGQFVPKNTIPMSAKTIIAPQNAAFAMVLNIKFLIALELFIVLHGVL